MREQMQLSDEEASVIYDAGRCGVTHEAAPKLRVGIRCDYEVKDNELFHKLSQGDNYVNLEVVELARRFLRTVEDIQKSKVGILTHLPKEPDQDTLDNIEIVFHKAKVHPDWSSYTLSPNIYGYSSSSSDATSKRADLPQ